MITPHARAGLRRCGLFQSCRAPFAKTRTHPVLSRMKYDTGNQVLHNSENFKGLKLNRPEVPEARLLLFLTEGVISSPLLKRALPIGSRGNPE